MHERLIILDFGSQTTQLIGRRVRELNMYCEIVPYNKFPHDATDVKGVILSGSPYSVYDANAFKPDLSEIRGKYPVLGICYGAQYLAYTSGGKVEPANSREYGRANLAKVDAADPLFKGIEVGSQIWMSHGDTITQLPDNFRIIASTADVENAAYHVDGEMTWGVQFHPEVFHTVDGTKLLDNFLNICGCAKDWTPASFIESTVAELKEKLGDDKVILALSGGVDSSVTAVLLNRAIGKNLTCIFVDHGLLRKNEFENVLKDYEHLGLNVIGVNAKDKFYSELAGVSDPEQKRKIIGKGFIDVFDEEAQKLKDIKWLGQGTIYPDVIESLSITGTTIKSHHNVGGLPKKRPRYPYLGRYHAGKGAYPARCRRYLHVADARMGPLRQNLAGRRYLVANPLGRRDGRRAHVREHGRPPRRNVVRCNDGGLGSSAVRIPRQGFQRNHQQGEGREPRRL